MELYLIPEIVIRKRWRDERGKFIKGIPSWNKGQKGLQLGGDAGFFKTGSVPHNVAHDGKISIRTDKCNGTVYKWIRISAGNWQLYHRHVWAQHNGPLLPGSVIRFKDGDTLNCQIDNLYLINRAEHMQSNHNYKKASATKKQNNRRKYLRHIYSLDEL